MFIPPRFRVIAAVAAVMAALMLVPSCATEDVMQVQSQLDAIKASLDEQEAQFADDPETLKYIAEAREMHAKAEAMLASVQTPDGQVTPESVLPAVGAALPPPWNLLVLIGGPLAIGAVQEWRLRQRASAAKSIVNGIDVVRKENPEVAAAMSAAKDKIHTQLTPLAKRIIDDERLT